MIFLEKVSIGSLRYQTWFLLEGCEAMTSLQVIHNRHYRDLSRSSFGVSESEKVQSFVLPVQFYGAKKETIISNL